MGYPICHEDPTVCNDDAARATTGVIYSNGDGKLYRYAQAKDAVTYADGQVCTLAIADGTAVTNDISGGSSIGSIVGGIARRIMTQNYYGYFLVKGYHATVKTSGADDIAIGENVFVHASTDGTCDGGTAATFASGNFGIAVVADVDAANTVAVQVNCLA